MVEIPSSIVLLSARTVQSRLRSCSLRRAQGLQPAARWRSSEGLPTRGRRWAGSRAGACEPDPRLDVRGQPDTSAGPASSSSLPGTDRPRSRLDAICHHRFPVAGRSNGPTIQSVHPPRRANRSFHARSVRMRGRQRSEWRGRRPARRPRRRLSLRTRESSASRSVGRPRARPVRSSVLRRCRFPAVRPNRHGQDQQQGEAAWPRVVLWYNSSRKPLPKLVTRPIGPSRTPHFSCALRPSGRSHSSASAACRPGRRRTPSRRTSCPPPSIPATPRRRTAR